MSQPATAGSLAAPSSHERLLAWVEQVASLTKPDRVHWCDGSGEEYDQLAQTLVDAGTFRRLSDAKRPNSYLALSDPDDVARVEDRTFICSEREGDAGPTNNWREPMEMRTALRELFDGSMLGRTMYVVPFSMGPLGSPISDIGVQLTDSAYVACSMRIMTRMGRSVLDALGDDGDFVPCLHSVGYPRLYGRAEVPWPCGAEDKYIVHFPETREVWSYGSGYGGNALLGKKCFALRIASVMARDEGWLAEHMLILKLTSPEGLVKYLTGAFPSACGKTNLAMLIPTLPGWKVETIGDDIAWMKFGRRTAVRGQPGGGVLRRRARHRRGNQPERDRHDRPQLDLHQLRADRRRGRVVGGTDPHTTRARHRLARPRLDARLGHTCGTPRCSVHHAGGAVPVDRARVGGPHGRSDRRDPVRRPALIGRAAVCEAWDWEHGVFLGSTMSSETTAAAAGNVGRLRWDPMAMLPFCGYHMADYFRHWLRIGQRASARLPRIFYVNWFRKGEDGRLLWPGYGENSRVLEWIFRRCQGTAEAVETPIGLLPPVGQGGIDTAGLGLSEETMARLLEVDVYGWRQQLPQMHEHYAEFGPKLPAELHTILDRLDERLHAV